MAILLSAMVALHMVSACASDKGNAQEEKVMLMSIDLQEKYDFAESIYLSDSASEAGAILESLIPNFEYAIGKNFVSTAMRHAWEYDLLIVHGRLARLYCEGGDEKKCNQHTRSAIFLSRSAMTRKISDRVELLSLVKSVDQSSRSGK